MNVYVLYLTDVPDNCESKVVQGVFFSEEEANHYLNYHPFITMYKPRVAEMYMITPQEALSETPSNS